MPTVDHLRSIVDIECKIVIGNNGQNPLAYDLPGRTFRQIVNDCKMSPVNLKMRPESRKVHDFDIRNAVSEAVITQSIIHPYDNNPDWKVADLLVKISIHAH